MTRVLNGQAYHNSCSSPSQDEAKATISNSGSDDRNNSSFANANGLIPCSPGPDQRSQGSILEKSLSSPQCTSQGTSATPISDCCDREQISSDSAQKATSPSSESQEKDLWVRKSLLSLGTLGVAFSKFAMAKVVQRWGWGQRILKPIDTQSAHD